MSTELEIWQFAVERLKRNESVMLLVVAESSGSSPGRQGFKMIVAEDDLAGSIGGGVMEVNLVELAREKLKSAENESLIKPQIHQKNAPNPSGMICSGKQTVIFRKLTKDDFKTVRNIIRYSKNNRLRYLQITESKFQTGWHKRCNFDFNFTVNNPHSLEAQVREVSSSASEKSTNNTKAEIDNSKISTFLYEEKLGYKNKLFIIGGGHCALSLSELMSKMDFHISLYDDRPNLNTLAKNEFAAEKSIIESYENIDDFVDSGANHFVVVMTLGYRSDELVIRKLLDKDFKYFGVLGSRAKMKTLLRNLENEGFAAERLKRIRTPIGLPINSRTPEEIAVSIAAEIIKVKNSK
jgi:xanthine dehydrogenase accessory factor